MKATRNHLLLILGAAVLLLAYVWQHIEGIRLGYRLERLQGEVARLHNAVVHQRVRLSSLTALERVGMVAKETLGMRSPRPEEIITIPHDLPGL
ncbi:MAG: cell division protein FtsL [Elusimicrobia bacterium]|nr:cell division protein FtsL [Elusimicrobiota bacterium]